MNDRERDKLRELEEWYASTELGGGPEDPSEGQAAPQHRDGDQPAAQPRGGGPGESQADTSYAHPIKQSTTIKVAVLRQVEIPVFNLSDQSLTLPTNLGRQQKQDQPGGRPSLVEDAAQPGDEQNRTQPQPQHPPSTPGPP